MKGEKMYVKEIPKMLFEEFGRNPREKQGKQVANLDGGYVAILEYDPYGVKLSIYLNEVVAFGSGANMPIAILASGSVHGTNFSNEYGMEVQTRFFHPRINDSQVFMVHPGSVIVYAMCSRAIELICAPDCKIEVWWNNYPDTVWAFSASPWQKSYLSKEYKPLGLPSPIHRK
jgi:hypothetical protein